MNDTPRLNRLFAGNGSVILLGAACLLGFVISSDVKVARGPATSSIDLLFQAVGILAIVFFFVVAVISGVAGDGSQTDQ